MRRVWGLTLLIGSSVGLFLVPQHVFAQACKDEVTMVEGSKQDLVSFTATVKQESLANFETMNHQKGAVSRISMHNSMLGELISCLDKAAEDPTLSKDDLAAAKAQHDASVKLKEKIEHQQSAVKEAKTPKDAKTLIENLDIAL